MDDRQPQGRSTLFEKHKENIYFRWGLTAFAVIVACVIVAEVVMNVTSVFAFLHALVRTMAPVFYGLGIAYLLDPIVGRVQAFLTPRLKQRFPSGASGIARAAGILTALVLLVLVLWALLAMVLPELLKSLTTIIGNLPVYYNTLRDWVDRFINSNPEIADYANTAMATVYNYLQNWLSSTLLPRVQTMVVNLTTSVFSMARALLNLVIGLIISVYLLMDKTKFLSRAKKLCYAILGEKKGGYVCNVCTFANQVFGGFIGGKLVDSLIIGVLCFLGLSALRMPYTMLISIIVGVTNVIPFFGPYLGAAPSALLLLVIDPVKALTFILFILILQQLDGNIIGPMILGDATGVSSFWVVVSILVFGSFWGVLGMFIAVPTFAVLYKIASEVTRRLLVRRGLSPDTADYEAWSYPPRPEADQWRRPARRGNRSTAASLLRALRTRSTDRPVQDSDGQDPPESEEP